MQRTRDRAKPLSRNKHTKRPPRGDRLREYLSELIREIGLEGFTEKRLERIAILFDPLPPCVFREAVNNVIRSRKLEALA